MGIVMDAWFQEKCLPQKCEGIIGKPYGGSMTGTALIFPLNGGNTRLMSITMRKYAGEIASRRAHTFSMRTENLVAVSDPILSGIKTEGPRFFNFWEKPTEKAVRMQTIGDVSTAMYIATCAGRIDDHSAWKQARRVGREFNGK